MTPPSDSPPRSRLAAALERVRAEQCGFTLVELLVACSVGLIVLWAVLDVSFESARSQERTANRVDALRRAQVGLERMTREIRQASSYTISGGSEVIDLETQVRPAGGGAAVARHVQYDCSGSACIRFEGPPGQPAPTTGGVEVVTGVQSAVMTATVVSAQAKHVAVQLNVTIPRQSASIRLDDGVTLRNAQ